MTRRLAEPVADSIGPAAHGVPAAYLKDRAASGLNARRVEAPGAARTGCRSRRSPVATGMARGR